MLVARIAFREVPLISASVDWDMDAIGDVKMTCLARDLPDYANLQGAPYQLIWRGIEFADGFLTDAPALQFDDNKNLTVTLHGFDDLGWLSCYRANTNSHYDESSIINIINDLMQMTGGDWVLGSTSTMLDAAAETTIDVRGKESLFAQMAEVVKAVPSVHLRYGGIVNGVRRLDIGDFGARNVYITDYDNLMSLSIQRGKDLLYNVVEAYGEISGDTRITLLDALNNPKTLAHPDYARFPISQDPVTGTYIVTDTTLTYGCATVKSFPLHKTRNDKPPTAQQRRAAGYALWLKTVRWLKQIAPHQVLRTTMYTNTRPLVCDRAFVRGTAYETVYDPVLQVDEPVPVMQINDWFRITRVSTSFEEVYVDGEHHLVYDLTLSSSDDADWRDDELDVYERAQNAREFDTSGASGIWLPPPVDLTYDASAASDCTDGKRYIFANPNEPSWVTSLTYSVELSVAGATWSLIQAPTGNNSLIICVQRPGGGWPPSEPITASVQWKGTAS